jgi:hypothetical protein
MRPHERPPPDFDGRQYLSGTGAADAGNAPEIRGRRARQAVQAATLVQYGIRELEHVAAARAAAQDECQQLVVAER